MTGHEQEEIPIKYFAVDKGMIEVVAWFNSFRSIITIYSCQGGKDGFGKHVEAYVLFNCNSFVDLTSVLYGLSTYGFAEVTTEYYEGKSSFAPIRFCARWKTDTLFNNFISSIRNGRI